MKELCLILMGLFLKVQSLLVVAQSTCAAGSGDQRGPADPGLQMAALDLCGQSDPDTGEAGGDPDCMLQKSVFVEKGLAGRAMHPAGCDLLDV